MVALFLILTIGFVSGMYVANESMLVAANEGVTKYKLEDGHFELDKRQMRRYSLLSRQEQKRTSNSIILTKQKRTGRKVG